MANRPRNERPNGCISSSGPSQSFSEPEVRRWPHPVDGDSNNRQSNSSGQTNTALYYIHCALSYQNQLLADIKALLEQLTAEGIPAQEEK